MIESMRASGLVVLVGMLVPVAASAEVELKNDGFQSGGQAAAQLGFVAGEVGASRFIAADAGRQLLHVQLLFGGATTVKTVTLKVWDDSAGADTPGAELYSGDYQLTGSDSALQDVMITDMTVIVPMQFRVGIQFQHDGVPSIMRDTDNTIDASKNFIMAQGVGWSKSSAFGLQGDWIIRAFVSDGATAPPDGAPGDAGVTGSACNSNPDCPSGQFCDTAAHECTFECRVDDDCGGGTCNSLGQCVGSGGGGGGCCQTDRGNGSGAFALAALVGLVVRRRRR